MKSKHIINYMLDRAQKFVLWFTQIRDLKLYLLEVSSFLIVQTIGLYSGYKLLFLKRVFYGKLLTWQDFLIAFLFAILFILISLKFVKKKIFFKFFFGYLIFIGTNLVFSIFLPSFSFLISLFLILLYFLYPKIIIHNFVLALAIIGVSIILGLSISPFQVIIILFILSIYDMIAVWQTKHMQKMFLELAEKGTIFALILPFKIKDFLKDLKELKIIDKEKREFLFLGTGDFALPLIFAISALRTKFLSSLFIVLGSLFGLTFIHFYFLKKERKSVPALPFLSLGAIIGFLLSKLIS